MSSVATVTVDSDGILYVEVRDVEGELTLVQRVEAQDCYIYDMREMEQRRTRKKRWWRP